MEKHGALIDARRFGKRLAVFSLMALLEMICRTAEAARISHVVF